MEQRSTGGTRRDFDFTKVKENVVGLLFVSAVMGVVGFVVGTWKRVDDLDVSHREVLGKLEDKVLTLKERVDKHTFQIEAINEFNDDGPRFTLQMGENLRTECSLLRNDFEHWTARITRNEEGLEELEAECRNLSTNSGRKK